MQCVVIAGLLVLAASRADNPTETCAAEHGVSSSRLLQKEQSIAQVRLKSQGSISLDVAAAARGGAIARRFMMRDGRLPSGVAGTHASAVDAFWSREPEVAARCRGLSAGGGLVLLDAGEDALAGVHWVLRAPASREIVHASVREPSGRLLLQPPGLCRGGAALLGVGSEGRAGFGKPVDAHLEDARTQISLQSEKVQEARAYAEQVLANRTAGCPEAVAGLEVLAAQSQVVEGERITLVSKLLGAAGGSSFHVLVVDLQVAEWSPDLVPAMEPPKRPDSGEPVAWCELLSVSTEAHLGQLAAAEGHEAVSAYYSSLGNLDLYRDAGPDLDSLAQEGTPAKCWLARRAPRDFDLRTHKRGKQCFTPDAVLHQGSCGSCWAVASAQAAAGRACMMDPQGMRTADGRLKRFSAQQVLSCGRQHYGCGGGSPNIAFDEYAKGITLEADYPYMPKGRGKPFHREDRPCAWGELPKPYRVTSQYTTPGRGPSAARAIREEIMCRGPVTAGLEIYSNFFGFFRGDRRAAIYRETSGSNAGGHSVTMVGFGKDSAGVGYWVAMNTWGPGFADGGYFKIESGKDLAGIETFCCTAPNLEATQASWMYKPWRKCNKKGLKRRGLHCVANPGSGAQSSSSGKCPTTVIEQYISGRRRRGMKAPSVRWPNAAQFPRRKAAPEAVKIWAELEPAAVRHCLRPEACQSSQCNGKGTAAIVEEGVKEACKCTCEAGYGGETCDRCLPTHDGYPTCRERCTRCADCCGHGAASGVKWTNATGAALDDCSCACDAGFGGARCELEVGGGASSPRGGKDDRGVPCS